MLMSDPERPQVDEDGEAKLSAAPFAFSPPSCPFVLGGRPEHGSLGKLCGRCFVICYCSKELSVKECFADFALQLNVTKNLLPIL